MSYELNKGLDTVEEFLERMFNVKGDELLHHEAAVFNFKDFLELFLLSITSDSLSSY
jgi:hypothetical protein